MLQMTFKKRLLRDPYLMTVITKVLIVILGFANSVFSTRFLGATLKGQQSYIMTYVFIFSLILDFGIYQGYSEFRKLNTPNLREKFSQFFKVQFLLTLLITIGIYLVMDIDYKYFLFVIPFQVYVKQIDFMCVIEDINSRNFGRIVATSFYTFVLVMIFILVSEGNLLLIFVLIISRDILEIILKVKLLKLKLFYLERKTDFKLMLKALKLGFFPMLTLLLVASNYNFDILILERMVDIADVGIYSLAVNLGSQLWLIPDAFKDVLFNKNARKDDVKAVINAIKFNVILSLFIVLGFQLFGRLFIRLLYEAEFERAFVPLMIIISGNVFMILYKFVYTLLISNSQKKAPIIIFLSAVMINIGLNFYLIPIFGINGAAIASLVSYVFCGSMFLVVFIVKYKIALKDLVITFKDLKGYVTLFSSKFAK